MQKHVRFGTLAMLAASLLSADATPKDDLTSAAKKLADKDNYAWKRTTQDAGGAGGRASEGKVEKDGYLWLTMTIMRDNTIESFKKGEKCVIKTSDGWQSFSEATSGGPGPASIGARLVQISKTPAAEAEELVNKVKDLTKAGDVYSGEVTEETAKSQIITGSGRSRPGPNAPQISGAKGSVKFWSKDGILTKYEIKVQAKMSIMGNERDIDRTITVVIEDVGSTKIQVPDDALKKMS
jgi:hypothetical protein